MMRQTLAIGIIGVVALTWLPLVWTEDLARIYVYEQTEAEARRSSWFAISCDGTLVAKLKRGTFFAVNVAPGRHALSERNGIPVVVDVRSGEESYVRLDWRIGINKPPVAALEIIPAPRARREMLYLKYIDASKVLSRSVLKADPRGPPRLMRRSEIDD